MYDNVPLAPDMILQAARSVDLSSVDCVFLCLPHTQSTPIGALAMQAGVKVIDLSVDLRIEDPTVDEGAAIALMQGDAWCVVLSLGWGLKQIGCGLVI